METANLVVRITSDGKGLSSGIKKATGELRSFYGFISSAVILSATKRVIDHASAIVDLSRKTGISTNALQAWSYAAKQNGADINTVSTALKFMQKSMVEAVGGNAAKTSAFARLGISLEQLKSMKPEDMFNLVAASLGKTKVSALATNDALLILGKTGDQLLPAFRDGFAQAADEAQRMGQIIDTETLAALDKAGDQFDRLAGRLTNIFAPVIAKIVTQVRNMTDFLQIGLGTLPVFLKALAAGSSPKDALDMAGKFSNAIIDARIRDDAATASRAVGLASGGGTELGNSAPSAAIPIRSGRGSSAPSADELTRIGLFRGGRGDSIQILRTQVQQLGTVVNELRGIRSELQEEDN